jgi:hypothetical protein
VTAKVISLGIRAYPIDVTVLRARCAVFDDGLAMNLTACRSRFGVLGLLVGRFAPQAFPRWVPIVEAMNPTVSRNPPDEAVLRPHSKSDDAWRHPDWL